MACDCKTKMEALLLERFKDAQPSAKEHGVELQGYCFAIIDGHLKMKPYMLYKATADYPLKKGGSKVKAMSGNLVFTFCPFCGARISDSD